MNAYFYDQVLTFQEAQRERLATLSLFGRKIARAPGRLVRLGIEDFRRYRRPVKS